MVHFWRNKRKTCFIFKPKPLCWQENFSGLKRTNVPSSAFHKPLDLCECQQYYPSTPVPDPFRGPGHCSSQISKCLRCIPPLKCQSTEEKHRGRSMVWGGKYQARPWGINSKCQSEIILPWQARQAKCWWACLKRSHHLGYSKCQPSTECFIHKKKKTFRTVCAVGGGFLNYSLPCQIWKLFVLCS